LGDLGGLFAPKQKDPDLKIESLSNLAGTYKLTESDSEKFKSCQDRLGDIELTVSQGQDQKPVMTVKLNPNYIAMYSSPAPIVSIENTDQGDNFIKGNELFSFYQTYAHWDNYIYQPGDWHEVYMRFSGQKSENMIYCESSVKHSPCEGGRDKEYCHFVRQ
jgi:hypothetical protein